MYIWSFLYQMLLRYEKHYAFFMLYNFNCTLCLTKKKVNKNKASQFKHIKFYINTEKIWICTSNRNTCQSALQTLCFYKKWDTCMRWTFNVRRLLLTNIAPFLTNTKNVYDLWLNEFVVFCILCKVNTNKFDMNNIILSWFEALFTIRLWWFIRLIAWEKKSYTCNKRNFL